MRNEREGGRKERKTRKGCLRMRKEGIEMKEGMTRLEKMKKDEEGEKKRREGMEDEEREFKNKKGRNGSERMDSIRKR